MRSKNSCAGQALKGLDKNQFPLDSAYSYYVLFLLFLFNILNYLDRSVLAILAEDIKSDLNLTDAQLGFLSGTIFAVFYATFGMALGRLADVWSRTRLISLGLAGWSIMTSLSGLARGIVPLAVCRFGVAVGEAGASPAAFSLIYDCFSKRRRTTALAIYSTAVSIGGGLGLWLGGLILDSWNSTWPSSDIAPLGLQGWQATFIILGGPGVLLSIWMYTIREPMRGTGDGITSVVNPHPFKEAGAVLVSMLPILNWVGLRGSQNAFRDILINIGMAIVLLAIVFLLVRITDSSIQWITFGIGVYAAFSWGQGIRRRDYVVFAMIFKSRALLSLIISQSGFTSILAGVSFWAVPYFQRYFGLAAGDVGAVLGIGGAAVGISGLLIGGITSDKLIRYSKKSKVYVWLCSSIFALISAFLFLFSGSAIIAYICLFSVYFFAAIATAPIISSINDLVLPRGRATTSAFAYMVTSFIGGAVAPYLIGWLSDAHSGQSLVSGESLRVAMLWSLLIPSISIIPAIFAFMHIEKDQNTLLIRARELGEDIRMGK